MTNCFLQLPTLWNGETVVIARCRRRFIGFVLRSTSATASLWICFAIRTKKVGEKLSRSSTKRGQVKGKSPRNDAKDSGFMAFCTAVLRILQMDVTGTA